MDFAELEVLVQLVQERSFSRAAEKLGRTQPSVSQALKRLEEEVGECLFDRSVRHGSATAPGRLLADYGRRLLRLRQEAQDALAELRGRQRGQVRLLATECVSLYLLPAFLRSYREQYPAIRLEVLRGRPEGLPGQVLDGNADFGFVTFDPANPGLEGLRLAEDALVLVAAPEHPLARKTGLSIPDLGGESFSCFSARTPARRALERRFAAQGVPLRIDLELSALEMLKDFIIRERGLGFLPRMAVQEELKRGSLREVPVQGLRIPLQVHMVWRRGQPLSSAAAGFLEVAEALCEKPESSSCSVALT